MNTTLTTPRRSLKSLTLAAAVSCVLAACATTPQSPEGAAEVRSKLTRLQSDPNLADRAPLAVKEAETAVRIAEEPVGKDVALGAHRVYLADRKVEIAMAQASTRYAEDQRETLAEERERARLAARTREADRARADADAARAGAADAARIASADAERAAGAAGAAALEAAELQRQIDELQAKETDRGLVLTLGDVLFTSGQADLKAGVASNLGRLATFLSQNPGRNVEIEGHTDNVGSDEYNQALSQRRADSVRSFLIQQGIGPERIRTSGKGEHQPVADNESGGGRQQNRRVEVIIENPRPATASN
jgi:outer membrane protein OmpA-like peptidoglycan-associated protein